MPARKPKRPPNRPRIITLTVRRLRRIAQWYEDNGYPIMASRTGRYALELDAHDARETRLDPSRRRRRGARR